MCATSSASACRFSIRLGIDPAIRYWIALVEPLVPAKLKRAGSCQARSRRAINDPKRPFRKFALIHARFASESEHFYPQMTQLDLRQATLSLMTRAENRCPLPQAFCLFLE